MATAWAPPTAWTSSMPSSAQAARMAGAGRPPASGRGGEATAIWRTPATCAGITFMITEEGSGTRPPGTYTPARSTGTYRSVTWAPAPIRVTWPGGRCASCTGRTRRTISSSAARSLGSSSARASVSTWADTRLVGRSTPSNTAVYSRTAAAPRSRTSSHTGRICARATLVSSAARGRTPASFSLVIPAAGCPRRSITESTRLVYGASPFARRAVHMPNNGGHPPGPVPTGTGQQFEPAGHHPGGQGPQPERAGRAEPQRIEQPGTDRQGGQLVLERGEPGVLPHTARCERGGKRPGEQPGHRQRPVLAHGEQVPERPRDRPAGQAHQAERDIGRDKRGRLGVDQRGLPGSGDHQQRARRQRCPAEPGEHAERRGPGRDHQRRYDGGHGVTPGGHGLVAARRVGEGDWHSHGRQQRTRHAGRRARREFRGGSQTLLR